MNLVLIFGNTEMTQNRTAFLGKSDHVKNAASFFLDVGGHAQQSTDGNDPGSPDPGNDNVVTLVQFGQFRCRKIWKRKGVLGNCLRLSRFPSDHADKTWAEPVGTGVIFVTC